MTGQVMTNKEYRQHEGISKSQLSKIAKSPMHFKYAMDNPDEDTPALLFGRALHKYILENADFYKEFAVCPICDRRTAEGKAIYKEFEETAKDKDVITQEAFEQIKGMYEVAMANPYVVKLLDGVHEMSYFWTDETTGEKCKCRPDAENEIGGQHILIDYKTTEDAETEAFRKSAIKYMYDLQAGMYTEGYEKATGKQTIFVFIAQEKKPPYALNILQADEFMIKEGNILFHDLLEIYHECKQKNEWPGYMGFNNEISNLALPKWLQKTMEG